METILIEKEAYEQMKYQIHELTEKVGILSRKLLNDKSVEWLESKDVRRALGISVRTLQYYRKSGRLPFSYIGNKIYHKVSDITTLLNANLKDC